MGLSSDAALENADVVLVKNDLLRFADAVRLARSTDGIVKFNVLFALGVIVVVGTLALLGHVPLPRARRRHGAGGVPQRVEVAGAFGVSLMFDSCNKF